ncbi:MAG: PilZ domain-containing protein [Acidimicrobiia bacterium]
MPREPAAVRADGGGGLKVPDPAAEDAPDPNARVDLVVEDGPAWSTRVEGVLAAGEGVDVAAPGMWTDTSPVRATLSWLSARGVVERRVVVDRGLVRWPPVWRLRFCGEPELVQRRAHVRAEWRRAVLLSTGGGSWIASACDLSEGGLRCLLPDDPPVGRDDLIAMVLPLGGQRLRVTARVVRSVAGPEGFRDLALELVGLDEHQRDLIRRHVFGELVAQRRRARGHHDPIPEEGPR